MGRLKSGWLGWRKAKNAILVALKDGRVTHERRPNQAEKNQLWAGNVSLQFVSDIVSSVKGQMVEYEEFDKDPSVQVWILRSHDGWYVKCYLREDVWFISVHR